MKKRLIQVIAYFESTDDGFEKRIRNSKELYSTGFQLAKLQRPVSIVMVTKIP